ncbi:MAG: bifunctional histidinol-phosphatase/imidazoleglycerol-phosphate dehydratase HisB [Candidatus Marinimicrobia bacterium]|nr:bifunctional histidinol-phosphatase/imidazoleglycerol-phosphate dehydratase HisB [Candidatus Neomarinimicrobiota bacterium]
MKPVLFIDRDGTIISEVTDETIDTMDKLQLLPGVINALSDIVKHTDYELVMISNQDGLGRPDFPEERFWGPHNFLMDLLKNEGIKFAEVLIDAHYEDENSPMRKPNTGLLTQYMNADYDLGGSYVIGDRDSDIQLAKNLHAKAIFIGDEHEDAALVTRSWADIRDFLIKPQRIAEVNRKTTETDIFVKVDIDGKGTYKVSTGIGFFDHMLELFSKHSGIDCEINVKGDLRVDEHHSIEDTGLALGEALLKALGNKRGIERYGFLLPMDEAKAEVALDLSGRPYFAWDVALKREFVGEMPTEMVKHFFHSFSDGLRCNLHVSAKGENEHHIIEGIFKALARSMKQACKISSMDLPSTKGIL